MPNIVYIATSLDGYIARKDGNLDWLMESPNPDNSDYGFSAFMDSIDGILMGRNTFETVAEFDPWPYPKPVFVLSSTMKKLPDGYQDKARMVSGDLKGVIESLNNDGIERIYVDGGKTIQSLLEEDLIDEMIITRVPIVLGSGIPLFGDMEKEIKFRLTDTEILNQDLVKSTYINWTYPNNPVRIHWFVSYAYGTAYFEVISNKKWGYFIFSSKKVSSCLYL